MTEDLLEQIQRKDAAAFSYYTREITTQTMCFPRRCCFT